MHGFFGPCNEPFWNMKVLYYMLDFYVNVHWNCLYVDQAGSETMGCYAYLFELLELSVSNNWMLLIELDLIIWTILNYLFVLWNINIQELLYM